MMGERVAIYPGSFDPLTLGHQNIIERGLQIVDRLIVAVVANPNKTPMFTSDERVEIIREVFPDTDRVEIDAFEGLMVDYCEQKKVGLVLRGLRANSDFEYEFEMAQMNRKLAPDLEFVFMMTHEDYFYVSSRLVREVATLGGDVSPFVPDNVLERLEKKLG